MNRLGTWAVAFAVIAAVVNVALAFLWFSLVRVEATMPQSERGYTVEALALNVTILEIILATVAFIIAILGFFGYVEIKAAAANRAESTAERVASDEMRKFFDRQANRSPTEHTPGSYDVQTPDAGAVSEAKDE